MAAGDFVTESQVSALVTALAAHLDGGSIYIYHGSTAGTARPSFAGTVVWVGTVAPSNAITARDFWIDTT